MCVEKYVSRASPCTFFLRRLDPLSRFPPPPSFSSSSSFSFKSPLHTRKVEEEEEDGGRREGGTTIPGGGGGGKGRRMEVKGGGGDAAFQTGRWSKSSSHRRPSVVRTGWPPGFGQEGFKASDGHSRMEEEGGPSSLFSPDGNFARTLSLSLSFLRGMGKGALLLASRGIEKFADSKKREGNVGMAHPAPPPPLLLCLLYSVRKEGMRWLGVLEMSPTFGRIKDLLSIFFCSLLYWWRDAGKFWDVQENKSFCACTN